MTITSFYLSFWPDKLETNVEKNIENMVFYIIYFYLYKSINNVLKILYSLFIYKCITIPAHDFESSFHNYTIHYILYRTQIYNNTTSASSHLNLKPFHVLLRTYVHGIRPLLNVRFCRCSFGRRFLTGV